MFPKDDRVKWLQIPAPDFIKVNSILMIETIKPFQASVGAVDA